MPRTIDPTTPVTVIALYRTREDSVDQVRQLLAQHSVDSEAEPGCRLFLAHQDLEDPTRFALYEEYDSQAAFEEHRGSPHFRENIEGLLVPMLTERAWRRYGQRL